MNIAEIAAMAGVSRAAVSRYFNDGYISEEKREAIRRVVEETGYRPSLQAQTLRTKKTRMIGVIVPKIASASIGKITEGILSVLNTEGYQMILAVTQNDPEKELEYLAAFDGRQVDGIILAATVFGTRHRQLLKKLSVPVVIVGQQLSGYCCVFHDDYQATYDLTRLFLQSGRTRLGYMGAILKDRAAGAERYRGFREAVEEAGYDSLAQRMVTAAFSVSSGYEKTGELLSRWPDLDGILCATDSMAAGALRYLRDHNISVPGQILMAGQGDSEIAGLTSPPLITVRYSYEKSGRLAVHMLMDILEQGDTDMKEIKLGYRIVNSDTALH